MNIVLVWMNMSFVLLFLNDILEMLYLFNRRINLGPIEKDLMISEPEIKEEIEIP